MQYSIWYLTWHILIFYLIYILTFDWHSQIGRNNMKTKTHTQCLLLFINIPWQSLDDGAFSLILSHKSNLNVQGGCYSKVCGFSWNTPVTSTGANRHDWLRCKVSNPSKFQEPMKQIFKVFFIIHPFLGQTKPAWSPYSCSNKCFFMLYPMTMTYFMLYIYSMSPIYIYIYITLNVKMRPNDIWMAIGWQLFYIFGIPTSGVNPFFIWFPYTAYHGFMMQERPPIFKMAQCMPTHPTSSMCIYIYSKHGKTPSEIVKWIKQLSFLVINHIYINPAKLLVFNPVCSFTFSLFMVRSAGAAPDTPSPTVGLSSRPYISSRTPLWSSEALRLRFLCWRNKKWLYMEGPSISFKGKIISQMVLKIQQVI